MSISLIFLAGGVGSRMKSRTPKQFLKLKKQPIAHHSLEIFLKHPDIKEVIVVCDSNYHHYFSDYPVKFAPPGKRRQDSVYNGFQLTTADWICVHDSARPFITENMLETLFQEGKSVGAAVIGMPMKATIKEGCDNNLVKRTLPREQIWEIQTPQFLARSVLEKGFSHAREHKLTVTDDVSLAELVEHPVKLVKGCERNLKITTPEDLIIAQQIYEQI